MVARHLYVYLVDFFFFQAEDGIRDIGVTGVQTCALPISVGNQRLIAALSRVKSYLDYGAYTPVQVAAAAALNGPDDCIRRSEERRVGKECRSRWSPYH